jgi:alpha-D-ribose 1-methylphosphonate 5-triphosphate diphosphatase
MECGMSGEVCISNARIVTGDGILHGSVLLRDGMIAAIEEGTVRIGQDLDGDYLLPGFVELHTDHLESHFLPRPGVEWPAINAVIAHDAQIAASGITTVLDSLRVGSFDREEEARRSSAMVLAQALSTARQMQLLRVDHLIHLRCELPCPDTLQGTEDMLSQEGVRLISVMDHTPGERQFTSIDKFREYYLGKKLMGPEQLEVFIEDRKGLNKLYSDNNRRAITKLAREKAIAIASHDDATSAHVEEALTDGAVIAEFPTTADASAAAHKAGLAVLMGAPNLVRGGSHSGNISSRDVAANGHLDILSSDYVPGSLLQAVFRMPSEVEAISLPRAVAMVSRNPARAVGLDDRGEIALGKRADLIHVRQRDGVAHVRQVWRGGERVI